MKQAIYRDENTFRKAHDGTVPQQHGISTQALFSTFSLWFRRAKTRRDLSYLQPEQLKDMGISYQQAQLESRKPFWIK